MSVLSKPYFHNETDAFAFLESVLWPFGPTCPHCGGIDRITKLTANPKKRIRLGLYRCGDCRKQFTVKVGTVFEHARIPLNKMLQAVHLMCSSKKGISAHQLHRILEVQYKTAWFLAHRIREAMRDRQVPPLGGSGKTVELDETLQGFQFDAPEHIDSRAYGPSAFRNIVFTLVERGGSARSFHIAGTTMAELMPIIRANVNAESAIMTDSASWYRTMNRNGEFASHDKVDHSQGEYVRYGEDRLVHTNSVEGFYSIFKRGMRGVYQHCSEKHLHRYLAEFDFRYSNRAALGIGDESRAGKALKGIYGKRLTYGGSRRSEAQQEA